MLRSTPNALLISYRCLAHEPEAEMTPAFPFPCSLSSL